MFTCASSDFSSFEVDWEAEDKELEEVLNDLRKVQDHAAGRKPMPSFFREGASCLHSIADTVLNLASRAKIRFPGTWFSIQTSTFWWWSSGS